MAVAALAVGGIAAALYSSGGKTSTVAVAVQRPHPAAKVVRKTKRSVSFPAGHCPLTDLPAFGGVVPQRPALLVKIGNEPGPARPQSGLNEADIVFDTPAEGFIMRYVAVYQCQNATALGPTRSVRWVDYHIAPEFDQPIIAFAGGIPPNVSAVAGLPWLSGANLLAGQANAAYRTTNRAPPDNLYTSTTGLYALFPKLVRAPKPIFPFTPALPKSAQPLASAELDFSGGTNVVWNWQPASRSWLHTYSGSTDIDTLTGQPVTATNVIIEIVPYTIGPYVESTGGTGDIQSETTGRGLGYVLRDGHFTPIVWRRPRLTDPTTFATTSGVPVGLAPGRTWVEIMTDTQASTGIHFTR